MDIARTCIGSAGKIGLVNGSHDQTGCRYATMGFTTVVEPAVAPNYALHAHLELADIPIIDKATLSVLGNDDYLLSLMRAGASASLVRDYVAWTLATSRALGIKVINAGDAAAFKANLLASATLTHTYIFPDQVIHQPNDPAGFPVGATVMGGYPSDYEMDPEIVEDPQYHDLMIPALVSLPALSIVMTGFGGVTNLVRTVRMFEAAGVSGTVPRLLKGERV